ncbi:MAG: DNA repair exonuclease [Nitrososphaerota archaeon]|nr:DNA repair exonuclease [Nitrososphaerota archaeon]MDG7024786.1 DNA repair exonuclease [Nitrososphaerota archaeon]
MPKFAHMSDIHIGAFRQPELRALVLEAFEKAIDRCISEKVSFIILAGDIFDSNIPDLSSVRRAAEKMKQAIDSGIRLFAIYGSHDFSPNYSSIVDVLDGAGMFTKAEKMSSSEGRVTLSFVQDPSGAKICGISGKKLSIDRDAYALLDKAKLEAEPGFKIFVFHGAIEELKPPTLEKMEAMSLSSLPAGFDYYAGGHIHSHQLKSLPEHANVAFPGPLFATDYSELLQLAKGEERGFYIVDFDESVSKVEFVPMRVCDVVEIYYSAHGKSSSQAAKELADLASGTDAEGKVILLTVDGELSEGKTSDIDFAAVRKRLTASAPLVVLSNNSRLTSKEQVKQAGPPIPVHITERQLFEKEISRVKSEEPKLRGEKGVSLAVDLLRTLKEGKRENETKGAFEERTYRAGFAVLGLEEDG